MFKSKYLAKLLLILLLCNACGMHLLSTPASRETKATVLRVSAEYLTQVVRGDIKKVDAMIVWSAYLKRSSKGMTKRKYFKQMANIKNRWTPEEHPLLGLVPIEVDVDDDYAEVVLRKEKQESEEQDISISLTWSGTGWMILADSVFGDEGLLAERKL